MISLGTQPQTHRPKTRTIGELIIAVSVRYYERLRPEGSFLHICTISVSSRLASSHFRVQTYRTHRAGWGLLGGLCAQQSQIHYDP